MEGTTSACEAADPGSRDFAIVSDDVGRFKSSLGESAKSLSIDVMDCDADGMVLAGERIVISVRLARASPARRYFVLAHEYAHWALRHHTRFKELVGRLLMDESAATSMTRLRWMLDQSGALRQWELDADSMAARMTIDAGRNLEDVARFWDGVARRGGHGSATHPHPADRGRALRLLASRLHEALAPD